AASVPGQEGAGGSVRSSARGGAGDRPVDRRRVRRQVLHEDRAARGGAGGARAAAGEAGADALRERAHDHAARGDGPAQDGGEKSLRKRGEEYAAGDTPMDGDMADALAQTGAAIDWGRARERGRGVGLACAMKDGGGTHTVSTAAVRVNADGSVTLLTGSVE